MHLLSFRFFNNNSPRSLNIALSPATSPSPAQWNTSHYVPSTENSYLGSLENEQKGYQALEFVQLGLEAISLNSHLKSDDSESVVRTGPLPKPKRADAREETEKVSNNCSFCVRGSQE